MILIFCLIKINLYAQNDSVKTSKFLEGHFKQLNPQALTHLWTLKSIDSVRILDLKTMLDSSNHEKAKLAKEKLELTINNKLLKSENNKLKRIFNPKTPTYVINLGNIPLHETDTINVPQKTDTTGIYSHLMEFLKSKKEKVAKKEKLYIKVDPEKLVSSFYRESEFTITLSKEYDSLSQPYIRYCDNDLTNPYLSSHPNIKIIKTTPNENIKNQWNITYLTKHKKESFDLEMRFAGYKIENSKVEIVVGPNDENFLIETMNWLIWLFTRSEVIFVILLTFLTNINKLYNEIKLITDKIKRLKRKPQPLTYH